MASLFAEKYLTSKLDTLIYPFVNQFFHLTQANCCSRKMKVLLKDISLYSDNFETFHAIRKIEAHENKSPCRMVIIIIIVIKMGY